MTNVQREDVTVTVRMRTGVGAYRLNQLIDMEPDTAAGLMSAKLADLMPLPALATGGLVTSAALAQLGEEGAADGAAARVDGEGKPRRRKAARDAVGNGVHDNHDAAGTKPVEGTNPS